MGGAFLLHALWKQLGIDGVLERIIGRRSFRTDVGQAIFAMVANRALDPTSKHAIPDWVEHDVHLPGLTQWLTDDQLYRAMDLLTEAGDELQKAVFFETASLLNLEVDLLLYDTTSSYFEMEGTDQDLLDRQQAWEAFDSGEGPQPRLPRPQVVNDPPLRKRGHSKDRRPDAAQIVIGLAVTREGIPVRCWVWPGNTNDMTTVATVKSDLASWRLHRVVWAVDRGMMSEQNVRELQRGGAHVIAGEKLRSGKAEVVAALSRAGRFRKVADNLEVKDIVVGEGEGRTRYVLVRNPREQERDRDQREQVLKRLEAELAQLPEDGTEHTKAVCELVAHPTFGRYLRKTKSGKLRIDRAKVQEEARLDGKYLLLCTDDSLSAVDVAQSYKQLLAVEAAWRSLKPDLDLRPMYHRLEARIRSHVLLCWLALLLVRLIEVKTERTWPVVRTQLDRIHRGVFRSRSGTVVQRTELTEPQQALFRAMDLSPPPRFEAITPLAPPA